MSYLAMKREPLQVLRLGVLENSKKRRGTLFLDEIGDMPIEAQAFACASRRRIYNSW